MCPLSTLSAGDAPQPYLVRDIRLTPNLGGRESHILGESIQFGTDRFLFAADGMSGVELWSSDGTEEGTALIKVIRPGRRGAMPHHFTQLDEFVLFVADDGTHGEELWRTDGTAAGTVLLKDIRPGAVGSQPRTFRVVGNQVFFVADDGVHGSELWRSDGTAEGTMLVKDIRPGPASSTPYPAVVMEIDNVPQEEHVEVLFPAMPRFAPTQQVLFFQADDGVTGLELWRTDGTEHGTVLVKDGYAGPRDATPCRLSTVGGLLYYAAEAELTGQELWRSDGTPEGTFMLVDAAVGSTSSTPAEFTDLNGTLLYAAFSDGPWARLWRSDGTEVGTYRVRPEATGIEVHLDPSYLTPTPFGWVAFRARVFTNYPTPGSFVGIQPCRSDGTFDGTSLIVASFEVNLPRYFTVFSEHVFFAGGITVWRTDGTAAGTTLIAQAGAPYVERPGPLRVAGGLLFFPHTATTDVGRELWISDGTAEGTSLVKDIAPGSDSSFPQAMREHLEQLVFEVHLGDTGIELWQSDGTEEGTHRLLNVRGDEADADPRYLTPADDLPTRGTQAGRVFFFADDGDGYELWLTEGDEGSTVQVTELQPGPLGVRPRAMLPLNDGVVWIDAPLTTPHGIWASDGTPDGTIRLADAIVELTCDPCPGAMARLGGWIVFAGPTPSGTHGVWITDGTPGGTAMLMDDLGEPLDRIPAAFTVCGDHVYFTARSEAHPSAEAMQLMKTDGTAAGTVLVADLWTDSNHAPTNLTAVGDTLFFIAGSGDAGRELWKSDGSEDGTILVRDIRPGPEDSQIDWMTPIGDLLYFTADGADGAGQELWRSNGTPGGTVRVADIRPGPVGSWPKNLGVVGNRLFFTANDGVHGDELWKSDGTAAGTVLVKNIRPGAGSSIPDNFVQLSGVEIAVFTAFTDNDGMELWVTDGTEAGTFRISDIAPGSLSAHPQELILSGDLLYFQATDPSTGRELWAIDVSDIDGDGIPNLFDNCPLVYNPLQEDTNLNGRGDACDACPTRRGGDLNGDIVVSEQDLPLFVDALLYPHLLDDDGRCAADVNGDGEVNAQDIAAFVQHLTQPES